MANYNFVIDSTFRPFTMQEMLTPFVMYKDAYDKAEARAIDLADKANKFKYLSESLDPDSRAAQIYKRYADDLAAQAADFNKNGLTMQNSAALSDLRKRYKGEIGILEEADLKLQELLKSRSALSAAGKTMLYSNDNPTIDDFLPGSSFNGYAVDSDELHKMGEEIGKSISSRIYESGDTGSTMQDMYRKWTEIHGVNQESIEAFMNSAPVQQSIINAMIEKGIAVQDKDGRIVNGNLNGNNFQRAYHSIRNGVYNGIIYEESTKPYEDKTKIDAEAQQRLALARRSQWFEEKKYYDALNGIGPNAAKGSGSKSGSGSLSSSSKAKNSKQTISKEKVRIKWDGNDPSNDTNLAKSPIITPIKDDEAYEGTSVTYDELPQYAKDIVDKRLGKGGNPDFYEYYFRPFKSGGLWNDKEAVLEMIPTGVVDYEGSADFGSLYGVKGTKSN